MDDAFAKHVRHASDMETLVGSDASGTEMTEELTGMEDVMAGKATEQTTFLLRSNEALRSEVKELHSQLGLVAEALRGEEGYIGAILGLLQSSDKNCWDIAHMVARSKATARALPSPQDQHSSASWSRAQAHSREQHLSIVPAVAWSSKQVAVGLVAMLSSRNEEQVSGASWAVAELVQTGEGPCQDCIDASCIPPLLAVVRSGNSSGREAAALALEMMSRDSDIHPALVAANCIQAVTQALLAEGESGKMSLTRLLERFSRTDDYQKDIVEAGGIAATVQLLEDGKPAEQQMAACVVARLAEDDSLRERLLQAPEVVPGLLGMMEDSSQGNSPARATAAKALELLVDSQSGPEAAHQAEAVPALLKVAGQCDQGDSDGELGTRSLRVLISLARNKDLRREIVKDGGVDVVMEVLTAENVDSEVQEAAAEMLDQMAGGSGSPVEVLKMDHIERLVAALRTIRNTKAQVFLLRVIRTQVQSEEAAKAAVGAGAPIILSSIISAYSNDHLATTRGGHGPTSNGDGKENLANKVAQMSCKCISAIAVHKGLVPGTGLSHNGFGQALHEGGVTAPLIALLRESSVLEVRLHAALSLERMVSNQRKGSAIQDIVAMGAAHGMVELLRQRSGGMASKVALTSLRHMALNQFNLMVMKDIEGGIELLLEYVEKGTEQEKELAARALWNLALLDDNHARIATGLVPLIQLLKTGTSGAKQASAKALSILAVDDKYSQRLVAAGCILPLVQMLVASDGEKEAAAGALANIAYDEDSRKAIAHAGAIEPLMHALVQATSDGLDRDQLSGNNLHSSLVEMTCQCLENLAFSEEIRHSIATPEGINSLMIIVRHSGSVSSRVAAMGTLTNLATNEARRLSINKCGGVNIIVDVLRAPRTGSPEDDAMLREASAKVLWNLCYTEESRSTVAEAGGVELLVDMLTRADTGRSAAARALWNLAYSESNRERIAAAGGVSLLVGLLRSSDSKEQEAATKALVNLTINEGIRSEIATAGAIQLLGQLLTSKSATQRAAAARALTNLAMHSRNRQDMQTSGLILPALVRMLAPVGPEQTPQEQKEVRQGHLAAVKALRNIVADEGPRQAAREEGAHVALQGLLADEAMDKETRDSILRVLEAMGEPKKRGTLLNPGLTVADRSFTHANLGDKGGGQ